MKRETRDFLEKKKQFVSFTLTKCKMNMIFQMALDY